MHSSLDNNDGRQESVTGFGTTHHTNSLIFQPRTANSENVIDKEENVDVEMSRPGTKAAPPHLIRKKKPPPLFIENLGDERSNLIEESFDRDLLWAIAGGYGVNNTD